MDSNYGRVINLLFTTSAPSALGRRFSPFLKVGNYISMRLSSTKLSRKCAIKEMFLFLFPVAYRHGNYSALATSDSIFWGATSRDSRHLSSPTRAKSTGLRLHRVLRLGMCPRLSWIAPGPTSRRGCAPTLPSSRTNATNTFCEFRAEELARVLKC